MPVSIARKAVLILALVAAASVFTGSGKAAWTGPADENSALNTSAVRSGPDGILWEGKQPDRNAGLLHLALTDDKTQEIVNEIERGSRQCARLAAVYRLDCLKTTIFEACSRASAGRNQEYYTTHKELLKLAERLNRIVRRNGDRNAPSVKRGRNSYGAIVQSSLRDVNRQAIRAIDETATKLLRSAGNSKKRKVHYTRIVNALNSTKKILRS